ncbi:MAG: hypothetical protein PVI57_21540 [Gemmatimonadota bacterium]|jgi:hypothetical protein
MSAKAIRHSDMDTTRRGTVPSRRSRGPRAILAILLGMIVALPGRVTAESAQYASAPAVEGTFAVEQVHVAPGAPCADRPAPSRALDLVPARPPECALVTPPVDEGDGPETSARQPRTGAAGPGAGRTAAIPGATADLASCFLDFLSRAGRLSCPSTAPPATRF